MVFLWDLCASCTLFTTTSANVRRSEVSFLADLRVSCTLFTTIHGNVNYSEVSFLNRPPCVLHIICNNLCDSEVRPTRDFIILNKSRTQPPRHEEDIGLRILHCENCMSHGTLVSFVSTRLVSTGCSKGVSARYTQFNLSRKPTGQYDPQCKLKCKTGAQSPPTPNDCCHAWSCFGQAVP